MTEEKVYRCDKCGKKWGAEEHCKQCEESHREIREIENKTYCDKSIWDNKGNVTIFDNYPMQLEIVFDNGRIVTYNAVGL